jgi:hypothetical protein
MIDDPQDGYPFTDDDDEEETADWWKPEASYAKLNLPKLRLVIENLARDCVNEVVDGLEASIVTDAQLAEELRRLRELLSKSDAANFKLLQGMLAEIIAPKMALIEARLRALEAERE